MDEIKKKSCVYITAFNERTLELSKLCFSRLGYSNIVVDNSHDAFHHKMENFRKFAISHKKDFELFVRSDADRLVFSGVDDLVYETYIDEKVISSEGKFYDGLMKRYRGGTPVLYKSAAVDLWNNIKVPNTRKPESDFISLYTANRTAASWKCYDILTNLHDFEQYPSKICNVLLNRYYRNHAHLYDPKNQEIKKPWSEVEKYLQAGNSITGFEYADFSHMDSTATEIQESEYIALIEKYESIYKQLAH